MINAIVMFLQSLNFIALAFGSWHFSLRMCGTICNFFCGVFTIVLAGTTLALRYDPKGAICAKNTAPVDYMYNGQFDHSGRTYADDANLLGALAIIGIVLTIFQWTICCIPLLFTPVANQVTDITKGQTEDERMQMKNPDDTQPGI